MDRMYIKLLFVIFLIPTLGLAQDCPVSSTQRQWVQEGAERFILDALYAGTSTGVHPGGFPSKGDLGYALTLPGSVTSNGIRSNPGLLSRTSLINVCTAPKTFPTHCISNDPSESGGGFLATHDFCAQLVCEGRSLYTSHVYATMRPEKDPDAKHVFEYAQPGGRLVYDPNPSAYWRVDATNSSRLVITGEFFHRLELIARNGERSRLSRSGHVVMTVNEDVGLDTMTLNMIFPALKGAQPVVVDFALLDHDAAQADGTIKTGGQAVATITLKPGSAPEFVWISACQ